MPLSVIDDIDETTLKELKGGYLIFYSSIESSTNKMWCPDCIRVERIVKKAFTSPSSPPGLIVYVGQRDEWKGNSKNRFRAGPWLIESVPTILRVDDNSRLVDDAITEEALTNFLTRT